MKVIFCLSFILFSFYGWSGTAGPKPNNPNNSESKFDFAKPVYKIKGMVRKYDGDYVIVSMEGTNEKFLPAYLPEEYKKNGMEVTFDGELGKPYKSCTTLNIHKIWVAYDVKEKYNLVHKNYELN